MQSSKYLGVNRCLALDNLVKLMMVKQNTYQTAYGSIWFKYIYVTESGICLKDGFKKMGFWTLQEQICRGPQYASFQESVVQEIQLHGLLNTLAEYSQKIDICMVYMWFCKQCCKHLHILLSIYGLKPAWTFMAGILMRCSQQLASNRN